MKKAPDKKNGEDGLPIPPYAVYNIGKIIRNGLHEVTSYPENSIL